MRKKGDLGDSPIKRFQSLTHEVVLFAEKKHKKGFMARTDADNRFRSSYGPYCDTGRFRSSASPLGSGSNGQNVDRETRDIYIPDESFIFLGADLSTAEDRITKVRSGSARLIERANRPPWEWDEHKYTATKIFKCKEEEIDYTKRYLAKRGRHGANYGLMGQHLSDELLKDGFVTTGEEVQKIIDLIFTLDPEILDYQRNIRRELMSNNRKLKTAWGREIDYQCERMEDALYRRAYAYKPQSECGDLMNMWGFKPLATYLKKFPKVGKINQQGHDSLLVSIRPDTAYLVALMLKSSLERPVNYDGVELVIPVEFSLGTSWKMEKEFKRFPTKSEFTDSAVELWEKLYNEHHKT